MHRCQPTAAIITEPGAERHHVQRKRHERTFVRSCRRSWAVASRKWDFFLPNWVKAPFFFFLHITILPFVYLFQTISSTGPLVNAHLYGSYNVPIQRYVMPQVLYHNHRSPVDGGIILLLHRLFSSHRSSFTGLSSFCVQLKNKTKTR